VGIPEQTSAQLDTIAQSAETGLEALAASARQTSEATAKGARHLTQAMAQHVHVEQAAHIGAQAAEAGVDVAAEREAPASPRPHLPDLESDERDRNVPDAALANWGLLGGAELEPPLASKAVLLLDAGWLAEQGGSTRVKKSDAWAQRSMRLGPRQTLPDEAFRSLSEVKSATHPSILRIACVSHCWLHPEHPDPRGINLHVLKDALKHLLREGDPKMEPWCGPGWGVLYDYCSLHQAIYQAKLTFEKKSSLMAALQKEGGAQLPADWRLATHEEVKENLAEVWRKLGQSDVCMLADNWKVDGTGKECKVMPQGNDEPPGDAIYVKDCRNQTRSPHHAEPRLGESDEERRIRLAGMTRLEPEETRLFGDALKFIGHFFSHQSTLVLMLSMSHADYIFDDSEVSSREYLERGWCACEAGLAMMVKAPSRVLDLGRVLSENNGHAERAFRRSEHEGGGNVSHRGSEWQNRCPKKWQALELPDAFRARLEKLSFSSPERDRGLVEALYREAFHHRLQSTQALEYQSLGWDGARGQAAAEALARVAESGCAAHLASLAICGNRLGDEGAEAIALALGSGRLEQLQELNLNESEIGCAGARALAAAMAKRQGRGLQLVELSLEGNRIRDDGAAALAAAVQSGGASALQRLDLEGNGIGDAGAQALGRALPYAPKLRELWLHGNEFQTVGRDALRSAWAPRDPSDLWV